MEGAKKLGFGAIEDLLAAVGDLKVTANQLLGKMGLEKEPLKPLKARIRGAEETPPPRSGH